MNLLKFISVLFFLNYVESANILFISPTASYSHSVVYFPIIRELSLRGHKVVTIMPDMINDSKLVNLTEIDVREESYKVVHRLLPHLLNQIINNHRTFDQIKLYNIYSYNCMDSLFQQPGVRELINHPEKYQFDLVITEWLTYQSSIAFADLYKCPLIGISSYSLFLSGYDTIGSPTHSTYVPNAWDLYVNPSSFWDRFKSFLKSIEYRYYYKYHFFPKQEYLVNKYFGNNLSSIEEIEKRVSLVLTNTNPVLHGSYPKALNLIQFGGIHEQELKPLSQELQSFLDSANNGFIYFSLGSNIKSSLLGEKTINIIIKVFKKIPYKVVWKYEEASLPGKSDNVFISQWFPQRAVLEHKNIKLFMTQGGLQSAEEAIRAQVPFIMIPFYSDQSQNSGRFQQLGIGKCLLRSELSDEVLENTIYEVINNKSYKETVTDISETLWDQPTKPLDLAIWWIEYVIRHKGAKYLRNPELDVPWYQGQLLDIYVFIFCFVLLTSLVIYVITRQLYFYVRTEKCKKNQKVKNN